MTAPLSQNSASFSDEFRDMEMTSPWTEEDFEEYARQEPLPPNQAFQLAAEEYIEHE